MTELQLMGEYDAVTVEKVGRLLDLLDAYGRNPYLRPRLALHGGTALNLFHLPRASRLSVDLDLLYVGSADVEVMKADREEVQHQVMAEAELLGLRPRPPRAPHDPHAGVTIVMDYEGPPTDYVKVDLNFLDRVPLLGLVEIPARSVGGGPTFPCVQFLELLAGKLAAVLSRVAVRDLYDLQWFPDLVTDPAFRALATYYYSVSDCFPQRALNGVVLGRFATHASEVERDLYPMLPAPERPTLDQMTERVAPWLDALGEFDGRAREYLRLLDEKCEYRPELIFGDRPDVLAEATRSPRMQWKLQNLERRPWWKQDT